jgi:hypothetical protein
MTDTTQDIPPIIAELRALDEKFGRAVEDCDESEADNLWGEWIANIDALSGDTATLAFVAGALGCRAIKESLDSQPKSPQ